MVGKGESGHWLVMDGPEEFGGYEGATKPMELLLISLAGCTGMDVISLLNKMKVELKNLEISVEADRKEEHPKVFTDINLHYTIYGDNVNEEKVIKAIKKSQEKYCSISTMLREASSITYSYSIRNS